MPPFLTQIVRRLYEIRLSLASVIQLCLGLLLLSFIAAVSFSVFVYYTYTGDLVINPEANLQPKELAVSDAKKIIDLLDARADRLKQSAQTMAPLVPLFR